MEKGVPMAETEVKVSIVMPRELHERLKDLADSDERTLTAYIVRALRRHADEAGKPNGNA